MKNKSFEVIILSLNSVSAAILLKEIVNGLESTVVLLILKKGDNTPKIKS